MADLKKLAEEIVGLTLLEAQELKTILKSVEDSSVENKSNALKTLDIAYSKGIITKNFRDRNKSKISKL